MKGYNFYSLFNILISLMYTKIFHSRTKLIRLPVVIRGAKHITFGTNFVTGRYCRIDAFSNSGIKISFGNNCQINDSVHIAAIEKISIGDDVLIASRVFITDHQHGIYAGDKQSNPDQKAIDRELQSKPVLISNNVWIGEGVVILPGVIIGENSIIGANSVVTKEIPRNSIACGNPAKVIKTYNSSNQKWC